MDKRTEALRNREKPPGLEGGEKRQLEGLSEKSDWIMTWCLLAPSRRNWANHVTRQLQPRCPTKKYNIYSQNLREKELSFQWRAERCYSCQTNWLLWRQLQGSNIFFVCLIWSLLVFCCFPLQLIRRVWFLFNTKTCPQYSYFTITKTPTGNFIQFLHVMWTSPY